MHSDHISAAPLLATPSSRWWQLWPLLQQSFWQGLRELLRKPTQSVPFVLSLALMLAMFVTLICISRTLWLQPIAGVKDITQVRHLEFKIDMGAVKFDFFDVKMFASLQQKLAAGQFSLLSFQQDKLELTNQQINIAHIMTNTTAAEMLGLRLLAGTNPTQSSGPMQVWISEALWREHFANSNTVLGQTVKLAGKMLTIAGVVEHFAGHHQSDYIQPYQIWQFLSPTDLTEMKAKMQSKVLLYRQFENHDFKEADIRSWFQEHMKQHGDTNAGMTKQIQITQQPYQQLILGQSALLSLALLAVGALLLAVTILNLANLTAGRFTGRQRDMALQMVAGCQLNRLRWLIFAELSAWTLPAFLLSLLTAAWMLRLLPDFTGDLFPMVNQMQLTLLDACTLLVIVLFLTVFLMLPLVPRQLTTHLQGYLAGSGKGVAAQRSLASGWLILQVLLSTSIVLTAGSLTLSSYHYIYQDLGYQRIAAQQIKPMNTTVLDESMAPATTEQEQAEFLRWQDFKKLLQQQFADFTVFQADNLPINKAFIMRPLNKQDSEDSVMVMSHQIDQGYIEAFQMPILHGRSFQPQDIQQTQPKPILINQRYASQLVGTNLQQAIDLTLNSEKKQFKVIGILQNTKSMIELPAIYQLPTTSVPPGLVLIKSKGTEAITAEEQQKVGQLLQQAGLSEPLSWTSLSDLFNTHSRQSRLNFYLIGLLAATSLLLAVLGVAGIGRLYSHQRRYELAVRLATGASQRQLYLLMLKPLLPLLALAVALALLISHLLLAKLWHYFPQLEQLELPMQLLLALLMWLVAALAGWWPVRQTLRQDPLQTLRSL
jgi:ABC-type antimicrobial peptide transport system permease subunit